MRDLALLFVHLLATIARLFGPGGARSVIAESVLVKHKLLVLNRSRAQAPRLRPMDRVIVGLCAIWMRPARLLRSAIVLKPSTILKFHRALVRRKYRLLFTPKTRGKPGPKGPSAELIAMIVEMKHRNPNFGYQRIADQISMAFGLEIDKDLVRRVLATHYKPEPGSNGPSWLTFLGHSKDSLWSVDLFRCESLILKSHCVMVVMDQFTRRIIGFAVHAGAPDGPGACRTLYPIQAAIKRIGRTLVWTPSGGRLIVTASIDCLKPLEQQFAPHRCLVGTRTKFFVGTPDGLSGRHNSHETNQVNRDTGGIYQLVGGNA